MRSWWDLRNHSATRKGRRASCLKIMSSFNGRLGKGSPTASTMTIIQKVSGGWRNPTKGKSLFFLNYNFTQECKLSSFRNFKTFTFQHSTLDKASLAPSRLNQFSSSFSAGKSSIIWFSKALIVNVQTVATWEAPCLRALGHLASAPPPQIQSQRNLSVQDSVTNNFSKVAQVWWLLRIDMDMN